MISSDILRSSFVFNLFVFIFNFPTFFFQFIFAISVMIYRGPDKLSLGFVYL